jgi:tripartite-type tricarboxylate transporter receptor subunit TctC
MNTLVRRRFLQGAGAAAAAPFISKLASAQSYPARNVRVILPYAPGGVTDVTARIITQKLSEQLGRQFYVENIGGASGNIGMAQAAKAAADGYTMLCAFSAYAVNPVLFDKVPYDPHKDFDPVTLAVTSTTVMVVNPTVPAKTVKELVDLVRSSPGKFSFSSAGAGTQSHLVGEQFRLSLGLDLVHVPFNGGAPAAAAVVSGATQVGFNSPTATASLINDGKLRVLAVTSEKRTQALPQAPTLLEAGYKGILGDSWVGFLVPAGTPKDIINLLQREIAKIVAIPEIKERFIKLGSDPVGSTPEEFKERIKSELELWAKVIRNANIKVQQ